MRRPLRLGVVTGLASEADCLRVFDAASRPAIRCNGAGPAAARASALALLAEGCTALISFGCAGGLDPRLQPGAAVVATGIADRQGHVLRTDDGWRARLLAVLDAGEGGACAGTLLGSDHMIASPAEKQRLAEVHGACAVDMESHAVASAAVEAGVPMMALRVVCDPATLSVPDWLDGVIGADGRPKLMQVVARLAAHPADVGRVLRLAAGQRAALATLRRVALRAGPLFALG